MTTDRMNGNIALLYITTNIISETNCNISDPKSRMDSVSKKIYPEVF